ncbi:MAG: RluA family pseudouridine synthase [Cyanobacteria bacterium P01_D01_bin.105]
MGINQGWTYRDRITPSSAGQSVLGYYTHCYPHSSAEQWQARIEQGQILLDNQPTQPQALLRVNQTLSYRRLPWAEPEVPLTFEVLYEDEAFWAIAKPAGLPVLPGGKFLQHTLLHQLRVRYPTENPVPLHRLGRGTSGVMLVAKSQQARRGLSEQFRARALTKTYRTLIPLAPQLPHHFTCTNAIGKIPYPHLGTLYACVAPESPTAKPARSECEVLQHHANATLLQVNITTGRPHQIRIHLAAQGYPLLGDPLYQRGGLPHPAATATPSDCGYHLHAHRIRLMHPHNGKTLCIEAPLPVCLQHSG